MDAEKGMDAESSNAEPTQDDPFFSLLVPTDRKEPSSDIVKRSLQAIRVHLGMEVAYVSQFVDNRTVSAKSTPLALSTLSRPASRCRWTTFIAGTFSKAGCRS
jgi:hypothetical protein